MKQAHLTFDAVFRPDQPSPTSLDGYIVHRLITSKIRSLTVNNNNDSAGRDFRDPSFGIPEAQRSCEFDHEELNRETHRSEQVNMNRSEKLGSYHPNHRRNKWCARKFGIFQQPCLGLCRSRCTRQQPLHVPYTAREQTEDTHEGSSSDAGRR